MKTPRGWDVFSGFNRSLGQQSKADKRNLIRDSKNSRPYRLSPRLKSGILAVMHCIVTAGPTFEPLDEVRRLTNFSSGRLGTELANYLTRQGHRVTLLRGEQATYTGVCIAASVCPFTTTDSLSELLHGLATEEVGAVFHAAAVSDFRFGKVFLKSASGALQPVSAGKLSTRSGMLLAELLPTPKIIRSLRAIFPKAVLVGWKYEVDGDQEAAIGAAETQIRDCCTDGCVVNGPAYGAGFGLAHTGRSILHLPDIEQLYGALEKLLTP